MRCNLRYKIFALMGGLVLGLLLVTLLIVDLFASLSAMQSFQPRIESVFFLITDDQGALLAGTGSDDQAGIDLSMHPIVQRALEGEEALHIWHLHGRLYQIATVALKTGPDILGTLSIGYEIDQALLRKLKAITGSAITLFMADTILASTWPAEAKPELMDALADTTWAAASPSPTSTERAVQPLFLGGETYLSLAVPLAGPQGQPVGVYILQQSMEQVLEVSLRKVELLEQVKTHLGKFVPQSVKRLIEKAPEALGFEIAVVAAVKIDHNCHNFTQCQGTLTPSVFVSRCDEALLIKRLKDLAKVINITEHGDELAHRAPFVAQRLILVRNNHHERSPAYCQDILFIPNSRYP